MIAVVTILIAFPAGYLLRSLLAANTTYAIAYLWAFVFQTLYLTLDSINRSTDAAFAPEEFPLAYGAVTLGIFGVGFGLVGLGHAHRARRTSRTTRSGRLSGRARRTHTWPTTTPPTSNSAAGDPFNL